MHKEHVAMPFGASRVLGAVPVVYWMALGVVIVTVATTASMRRAASRRGKRGDPVKTPTTPLPATVRRRTYHGLG